MNRFNITLCARYSTVWLILPIKQSTKHRNSFLISRATKFLHSVCSVYLCYSFVASLRFNYSLEARYFSLPCRRCCYVLDKVPVSSIDTQVTIHGLQCAVHGINNIYCVYNHSVSSSLVLPQIDHRSMFPFYCCYSFTQKLLRLTPFSYFVQYNNTYVLFLFAFILQPYPVCMSIAILYGCYRGARHIPFVPDLRTVDISV